MKSTSNSYKIYLIKQTPVKQRLISESQRSQQHSMYKPFMQKKMPNVLGSGCFCKPVFGKMSPCWNDVRLKRNMTLERGLFGAIIPAEICTIENTKLVDISRPWNIHIWDRAIRGSEARSRKTLNSCAVGVPSIRATGAIWRCFELLDLGLKPRNRAWARTGQMSWNRLNQQRLKLWWC